MQTFALPRVNMPIVPAGAKRTTSGNKRCLVARANNDTKEAESSRVEKNVAGLGDLLGPIGLTVGKSMPKEDQKKKKTKEGGAQIMQRAADAAGLSLGPIGLTVGSDLRASDSDSEYDEAAAPNESIATLSTDKWREQYEKDGKVDLWVREEFNAASRVVGGRAVHFGGVAGSRSGEGPAFTDAPRHKVKIFNHFVDQEIEVEVPEDRYILWEAEDQGLLLPYACRMGCCTACAVKVKEGEMYQPQSLGISQELKDQGYALMCVGFPLTDLVLETVPEDEIYEMQFGRYFEMHATNPNSEMVVRDDYAIELALLDE